MATRKGATHQSAFQVGARVRVKSGVADPDYPDIPLGGWVGTIKDIERDGKKFGLMGPRR